MVSCSGLACTTRGLSALIEFLRPWFPDGLQGVGGFEVCRGSYRVRTLLSTSDCLPVFFTG